MLNVKDDELVVEEKGIYSVEKFIVARRLMYWQVYLHKTGLGAEKLLEKVLMRAKELVLNGTKLPASKAFNYFLTNQIDRENFTTKTLKIFAKLDNYDVLASIKEWISNDDFILSELSESLINRKLPKVVLQNQPFTNEEVENVKEHVKKTFNLSNNEVNYLVYNGEISNQAYDSTKNTIKLLFKNGEIKDVIEASDHLNIQALSKPVNKYYLCYPKK